MDVNVYANLVALAQQSVANQMRFYADNQKLDNEFMARFEGDDDGDDGTDSDTAPHSDAGERGDTDQPDERTTVTA